MNLRVFDKTLTFVKEIDNYAAVTIKRKYRDIESITIKIDKSKQGTEFLVRGAYLFPDNATNKFFRIYQRIEDDGDDAEKLQIVGYSVLKLIKQRITIPPAGQESHVVTGNTETIIKTYVDSNCVHSSDSGMNFPFLQLATDQARGQSVTDSTRYKNLYSEVLRVLTLDDMGCKANFNISTKKLIFDVYIGHDRSKGNTEGNPPVIFSKKYDNINSAKVDENESNKQNYAIVGGSGTGASRLIQAAYAEDTAPIGVDRTVFFVDARSISDPTELINEGLENLVPETVTLDADINPYSNQIYEVDFNLGDVVTVIAGGRELDTRITEIVEAYEAGKARQINIIFGSKAVDILDTIKNNSSRISKIETI